MKEFNIPAAQKNLDDVLDFVHGVLDETEYPMKVMVMIDLCVEEVFVNIAHYAYGGDEGPVKIEAGLNDEKNEITITFYDNGTPYDPLLKEDPDTKLNSDEREIGGLGIFLVKKKMDDVRYEYKDGQNVLTLVKSIVV